MMLPFGVSMLGGALLHVAALLVLLVVAVTFNCTRAGSRVEHGYIIIRPYAMHCATAREAEDGCGLRILRCGESWWLEGSRMSGR